MLSLLAGAGTLAFAGESACPASEILEFVTIERLCADGGDPNEDVDPVQREDSARWYTPRPPLSWDSHTSIIEVQPNSLGFARIRTRLVFESGDLRNVITTIPVCTRVRAAGPMKNSTGSLGIGYSIRLRDPTGQQCQGFISDTIIAVQTN